jgi:hypothetical protein
VILKVANSTPHQRPINEFSAPAYNRLYAKPNAHSMQKNSVCAAFDVEGQPDVLSCAPPLRPMASRFGYWTVSFNPSSRSAVFVSSTDCLDTPPSGETSTATVNRRLLVVANRDNTLV